MLRSPRRARYHQKPRRGQIPGGRAIADTMKRLIQIALASLGLVACGGAAVRPGTPLRSVTFAESPHIIKRGNEYFLRYRIDVPKQGTRPAGAANEVALHARHRAPLAEIVAGEHECITRTGRGS